MKLQIPRMIRLFYLIVVHVGLTSINAEELLMGTLQKEGKTKEEALQGFPFLPLEEVKVNAIKMYQNF